MVEMAIVIVLIGISIVLLCIRMIFKKNGQFSSQHISENARMKKEYSPILDNKMRGFQLLARRSIVWDFYVRKKRV